MKVLWLMPPSKFEGEVPLVSQNRWFKYLPNRTNFIYPVIAATGCTMIKEAGFDIEFLDAPAEKVGITETLSRTDGFDLIIMEGRTAVITWLWMLSLWIKERAKIHGNAVKIALYGDHVMVRPEESLEHDIDHIIHCGDYDWGAYCLCEEMEAGKKIPPIFKKPLMKNLDDLPFIDRDLVPWNNYYETWRHKDEFGWVQSGRGCPAFCTFCSWVYTFYHHTLRTMSPERVVDEIEYATNKWGIKEYLDDADTFLTKWGVKFAKELMARGIDVYWNMQTRADQVSGDTTIWTDLSDYKLMKKSGLHVVKLGADAANAESMERIKKGMPFSRIKDAVNILKKAGVEVHINMVIGYPWEDKETAYNNIEYVKSLRPNQAQFSLIEPFPGTPIFDEAVKEGWFVHDPYDWDKYDMKTPILAGKMTPEEIAKLHRDAWGKFYLSPRFMLYQFFKSLGLTFKERNFDSFRHLWRGYKGVTDGHMKAVEAER